MKALYIHGLHSDPNPRKIKILKEAGLEVIAPFIDYEKEQGAVYARIKAMAIHEKVDVLIGSSMGGFIGYWLAYDLNKPALLYNPAVYFDSMKSYIPHISPEEIPHLYVCLGEQDQRVDPQLVKAYLMERNPHQEHLKILTSSWLEHGIDLTTFASMTAWFLKEIECLGK